MKRSSILNWPTAGGEMGALIRAYDWSLTSLGALQDWPHYLKTAVDLLLGLPAPAVLLWGSDGYMIYNDAYAAIAGRHDTRLLGRSMPEGWPGNTVLGIRILQAVLAGGSLSYRDQEVTLSRNGKLEQAWFNLDSSPILDDYGKPAGVLVLLTETTGRIHAERALREREKHMSAIFAGARVGLSEISLTGRFLRVNNEFCRILGRSREALLNMVVPDVTHPDDAASSIAALKRLIDFGQPVSIDKRYMRPDGSIVFANSSLSRLDDESGNPRAVLAVTVDLTERKRTEDRLRESEERIRLATEAANLYAWEIDRETQNVRYFGDAESILGFPPPRHAKDTVYAIHPDDLHVLDEYRRALKSGEKFDAEVRFVAPDSGEIVWLHTQGHVAFGRGHKKERFVGVTQNITQRKYAELNMQLLASINADLAMLTSSEEIMHAVSERVARHLGLSRLCFVEVNDSGRGDKVLYHWHEQNMVRAHLEGCLPGFANELFLRELRTGHTVVVGDTAADQRTAADKDLYRRHEIGAQIFAPHLSDGKLRFVLSAHRQHPYHWRADQAELIHELSTRVWLRLERAEAERALHESEQRFRALAEASPALIWQLDPEGNAVYVNPRYWKLAERRPDELLGDAWRELLHPDDAAAHLDALAAAQYSRIPLHTRVRFVKRNKECRWLDLHAEPWFAADGSYAGHVGISIDVTDEVRAQEELAISNERLKLAIEGSGDVVWDWNINTSDVAYSGRHKEMLGIPDSEVFDHYENWKQSVHPDDLPDVLAAANACMDGATSSYKSEYRMRCRDGSWKWVMSRAIVVARDAQGNPLRMTGTLTDISDKRRSEEVAWHHANYDTLTGLPNRRLFRDRLDQEVKKAHRTGMPLALLFIDLDRFKEANDMFGHDVGDLLLIEAAKRLSACVRESDTVARLGGDEFTAILSDLDDVAHVDAISEKIVDALSVPFRLGNEVIHLSASVGITLYPADAINAEELIRNADQAMYASKSGGRNQFNYFTRTMQQEAHTRLRLIGDLRNALSAGQLKVYYQPVIDLKSGQVTKAEALLRWLHPKLGMIEPARFIAFAEECGLINEIGDWVFKQAASCALDWGRRVGVPFQISINKSPIQFLSRSDERNWAAYLHGMGLSGSSISVEITEGMLLNASSNVIDKLLQYRDSGIQVAIDDFGTGYSSLAYLRKFDIDYLKIDASFVRDIAHSASDHAIVRSMIAMAHELGLKVIAEGIETLEQKESLVDAGCDFGQGFLFSQAIPPEDFARVLEVH